MYCSLVRSLILSIRMIIPFIIFVIMVFDEKYFPLTAALSVMLGSFKNHGIKKG